MYKYLYNDECLCLSANREFKLSLWQDYGFDTAADMIVDYYKWVCCAIFSKHLMSDTENAQRNKE
ncbi:hypothetical protein DD751_05575 [Helicobacter pylori]|uniref:Uncharacterized protein n=1 Tax=Helicobacter pylori TaxID=210 RepID=A0A496H350_HELPX|nr:hypothetical protein DD751_05575 [Helicobacter pylori]